MTISSIKKHSSNISIRLATKDDAFDIARIRITGWRDTYRGIIPDEILDSLDIEKEAEERRNHINLDPRRNWFLALKGGQPIGFSVAGPAREGDPQYASYGEIYAIYVSKAFHGNGAGTLLLRECFRSLKELGFSICYVWVLVENPFRKFYQKMGGEKFVQKELVLGKTLLEEAYRFEINQRAIDGR